MTSDERVRTSTVLLYSDDPAVRARMRNAIGTRPAADLAVTFVEASTHGEVIRLVDRSDFDLLVLDGEATPSGGLGIARQLKDEIRDCPPTCVVIRTLVRASAAPMAPASPMAYGRRWCCRDPGRSRRGPARPQISRRCADWMP